MLFAAACKGLSAPADGDNGKASPGASTQATRTPSTPAAAKNWPNLDFAAFQAEPCPKFTDADRTRGDLITTVIDPREGITLLPGGESQTVLVKLCNTTGKALPYIAISAQVEWSYAGEREPWLWMERREAPDGDWHPDGLRATNEDHPRAGASGARDLPAHGTRIVEYWISAAEDAPASQGRFGINAIRTDWDPFYTEDPRGGGHGAFQLTIAPRE